MNRLTIGTRLPPAFAFFITLLMRDAAALAAERQAIAVNQRAVASLLTQLRDGSTPEEIRVVSAVETAAGQLWLQRNRVPAAA